MNRTALVAVTLASLVTLTASNPIHAAPANFSFTGNFADRNELQPFEFDVAASALVILSTRSYEGGKNAAGSVIPGGGFDPIVSVFDAAGNLLAHNDDYWRFGLDALVKVDMEIGTYRATLTQYPNFPAGTNLADGFCCGAYGLGATHWALDIFNVQAASQLPSSNIPTSPIPEPQTWALMLLGIGGVGAAVRRRQRLQGSE